MTTREVKCWEKLQEELKKMTLEELEEIWAAIQAIEAGEIGDSEEDIRRFHEEYQNRRVQK